MVNFCQKCGKLLIPQLKAQQKHGIINLHCTHCNTTEKALLDGISYQVKTRIFHNDKERSQIIETDFFTDPIIRQSCPKCRFMEAYYWQGSNRRKSEWEPMTYYRCVKCNNTWND